MMNKGKKRVISELDSKTVSAKPSQSDTNAPDKLKELKKKKVDSSKLIFDFMTKKQSKAKQLKQEKRKLLRREHGQYKMEGTVSKEAMRQKIDEIQSRGDMTKTAKRRLRILKKKLSIAEGNAPLPVSPTQSKIQAGDPKTTKLTKNQKKQSKQVKMESQIVPQNLEGIKKEIGSKKNVVEQSEKNKKLKKTQLKTKKAIQIKAESPEENDDNEITEDGSGDESVQTSQFKMEVDDDSDVQEDEVDDNEEDEVDVENGSVSKDVENVVRESFQKKQKVTREKKNSIAPKASKQENGEKKQRYVLFVGNLSFKSTVDDLKKHFLQKVSEVVSVRIPTHKVTNKPRGFAYVEVNNNVDYEKALSLHQSTLLGFKLNVEYTQTGSKNIKNNQEIVAKNKKLHAIRKAGKLAGSKKENGNRSFRRNFNKKQKTQQD